MNNLLSIFEQPIIWTGLAAAVVTAAVCAYLGIFVIMKRVVFVSIALAEVAGLGVILGLLVGFNPQVSALLLTLLAIILFWYQTQHTRSQSESLVGLVYCLAAAGGIILLSKNPLAHIHGLDIVSGNFLYAQKMEIILLIFIAGVIMTGQLFFAKEFISTSFDRDFAQSTGMKAKFWDFFLYFSLGLIISLSMRISGLIFVFGSLLVPAMVGLLVGRRIEHIFLISIIVVVSSTLVGFILSYRWDLPTAPAIVSLYGLIFIFFSLKKSFRNLLRV